LKTISGRPKTLFGSVHSLGRERKAITGVEAVLLILILVAGGVGYYLGTVSVSTTSSTTTVTATVVSTVTSTVTPAPPKSVSLGGFVSTKTYGTNLQGIQFVSQSTGISYPGTTTNEQYSASLPNQETYEVRILWTSAVNSGSCSAGLLPLYLQSGALPVEGNWSC